MGIDNVFHCAGKARDVEMSQALRLGAAFIPQGS